MSDSPTQTSTTANEEMVHPPGFRPRRGMNWFMLGLMYASYYTCRYNISVAAPRIIDQFGFSNTQYGWINSSRHLCYAFGQLVNGLLTDRIGGKQAMALGAVLTIVFNIAFGMASFAGAGSVLILFMVIRGSDGYAQAFGAPGFIKVNTAWFPRSERGRLAGVFGVMIQLGQIMIFTLGPLLLAGCSIPLIVMTLDIPALGWQWLFWIPPCVVAVVVLLMYAIVENTPEEAGYSVKHDPAEEHADGDHEEKIPLLVILKTIARKKMVWITAVAYFCTGVVRTAQLDWWVLYFDRQWGLDITASTTVLITGALLPISAIIGSISAGFISDLLFKGRRAPVAMALYGIESVVILCSAIVLTNPALASATLAAVFTVLISLTCNSTHSILGFAAAMDLGGRKMAGCAAGVIDSFQYFGAFLSGVGLGRLIDWTVENTTLGWTAWFWFMLPFSVLGFCMMTYVWWTTRDRQVTGA
ncbi:MAG: MFS transporter [Planctomycetes bacterium]|nr:MFS transporter [Planctomycetota bacterium]